VLSADYQRLRAELLHVLQRFPETRAEISTVFRRHSEIAAKEMQGPAPKTIEAMADHAA
jgi:hypothetical protein